MLKVAVLLLSLWTGIDGVVNFRHSQLFDEFDLRASTKIPLRCTEGCYVYASLRETVDEQFESSIVIRDDNGRVSHSLCEIGRSYDAEKQMQKKVYELPKANGNYSIVRTGGNLADTQPVAIYVVCKKYIDSYVLSPPPVFEPRIQQAASVSAQQVVFLSAEPFTVTGLQLTQIDQVRIVATGPDTEMGEKNDDCYPLYFEESDTHPGLILPIRSPIVTVSTGKTQPIHLTVSPKLEPVKLTNWTKTLVTSSGYIGCSKLRDSAGIFHWRDAESSINTTLVNDAVHEIFVPCDFDTTDLVTITGEFSESYVGKHREVRQFYSSTLKVEWTKTTPVDESFALRIRLDGTAPAPSSIPPNFSTPPAPTGSTSSVPPNLPICGQTPVQPNLSSERIVGGQIAVPYSWPWQIVLCTSEWFGGCSLHCGGTIIDNGWVMTAGHCVEDDFNPNNYLVKAGVYKEDATVESGEQISKVKAIHLIPHFDNPSHSNDISLIELSMPLKYTDHVQPICLPADDTAAIAKPNSAYVTGWGRTTEHSQVSFELRQVKIPFVQYETCKEEYSGKKVTIIEKTMVCAGVEGMNSCQGDSGGPLAVQGASGRWFQVGIVSFADGCAREAGVFARVTAFCDFISATTSGKASCQPIA